MLSSISENTSINIQKKLVNFTSFFFFFWNQILINILKFLDKTQLVGNI